MDDCDSKAKEQDCGGSFDRCATMSLDFKTNCDGETKSFSKLCHTEALCNVAQGTHKSCKIAGGKCGLDCCSSDGCNSGTAPVVSVLLMVACILVAISR